MEDMHSILINIISNFIWLPVGAFLTYFVFFLRIRQPNRKIWQLIDPSCLVVCAANSTVTNTGVYQRPSTGIGQVRAMALALKSLHNAYRKQLDVQNILLSSENLHERIENDLLILGGPKNNSVAAKYLELLDDEQPVRVIGNLIIWRTRQQNNRWIDDGAIEYSSQVVKRQVVKDHGLIMRSYNPFTLKKRTTVLLSGVHTYGTVAAAKFFTEELSRRLSQVQRHGKKNIVILISTHIVNGHPTKITVEKNFVW